MLTNVMYNPILGSLSWSWGFVFLGFENFVNNFTLGFCFSSVIMLEF